MPKSRVRYIMIGECSKCGREFVRPPECDVAVCDCRSVTEVPLHPVIMLPTRMYNRFQKLADRAGVSVDALMNKVLELGLEKLKGIPTKEILALE